MFDPAGRYVMEQGEVVCQLLKRKHFLDPDACDVDLLEIPGPVETPNRMHRTFTELFLYKDGAGVVYVDDIPHDIAKTFAVLVHKGQRHRLSVDRYLAMYAICVPFHDPADEENVS